MDRPTSAKPVVTRSRMDRGWVAATMPIGMPMSSQITAAPNASDAVTGMPCASDSVTGCLLWYDAPNDGGQCASPVGTPSMEGPRYRKCQYRTGSGSLKWYFAMTDSRQTWLQPRGTM